MLPSKFELLLNVYIFEQLWSFFKLFQSLKIISFHFKITLTIIYFHNRTTIEQLNNEITALDKRIITIKKQIDLPSTEGDIKLQMAEFLKVFSSTDVMRRKLYILFCLA